MALKTVTRLEILASWRRIAHLVCKEVTRKELFVWRRRQILSRSIRRRQENTFKNRYEIKILLELDVPRNTTHFDIVKNAIMPTKMECYGLSAKYREALVHIHNTVRIPFVRKALSMSSARIQHYSPDCCSTPLANVTENPAVKAREFFAFEEGSRYLMETKDRTLEICSNRHCPQLAVREKTSKINREAVRRVSFWERSLHRTRSGSSVLRMPLHRTAVYDKSLVVTACRLWNSLPRSITSLESRPRFVASLREHYLGQMVGAGSA
ncbi:hypothetical protein J6590_029822 [Homalodisca vitripennis]|nr:hypothetical protein J6590_029822 [Homalodisca vitripennis]